MVQLGDRVRDTVSGFEGVAVSSHSYLHGCVRISVQPAVSADGKLPETVTFDAPQLETVQDAVVPQGDHKLGGPEKYSDEGRR